MARKEDEETERFHALLYKSDMEFLRRNYGNGSAHSNIGISKAIRTIVHQRVQGLMLKTNQAIDGLAAATSGQEKKDA